MEKGVWGSHSTLPPIVQQPYRPDIDGLRAVAVVSVIFYHLSIPGFSAGYVGVDVFFVISGFVITRVLFAGFEQGSLTLFAFYERRVRRLMPALVTMLSVSAVAAYLWMLPEEFDSFAKSLFMTVLGLSNFHFAVQDAGYFAADTLSDPLLHTWTLAVEEQFYLLYPIGVLVLVRVGASARTVLIAIVAVAVLSFAFAWVGQARFPTQSFFLLPSRAWELALGAWVARVVPLSTGRLQQAASIVGILLIGCCIADVNTVTSMPIALALVSCLGTAMVILANSRRTTLVGAFLSIKPVVAVGRLSYSLYLWHWPTIVFYRLAVSDTIEIQDVVRILAITALASTVSWAFVERPFLQRRLLARPAAMLSTAFSVLICFAVAAALTVRVRIVSPRLHASAELLNGAKDVNPDRRQCILKQPDDVLNGRFCVLGNAAAPSFLVWGDSHADPWMPVFRDFAMRHDLGGLFAAHGGCPPLLGVRRVNQTAKHRCKEFNDAVFAKIEQARIKNVVLAGRWYWYIYGAEKGGREDDAGGAIIASVDGADGANSDRSARERVFRAAVADTVGRLRSIGVDVWILDQPPTYTFLVPLYLARREARGVAVYGRAREEARQRQAFQLDVFRSNDATLVDTSNYLCPAAERFCRIEKDGRSLYSDFNHLSVFGARAVMQQFDGLFSRMQNHRSAMP